MEGKVSDSQPRGRRRGEMTVATIARLAGVSSPTVSKVLNGRSGVASDTRRQIESLLREHGYRRPEAVGRAPTIEVLFHALESHLAIEIMRGVESVAREHDLAVGFGEMGDDTRRGRGWVDRLLARRPTGLIVVYSEVTARQQARLAASGIPMVALDPTGEPLHTTPSVGAANWSGGVAATQHLLKLGHRRIAVLSGPPELLCARARLDGFRAAMDAAKVKVDDDLVMAGKFDFVDGVALGSALLRHARPPSAVVCGNDLQALGIYEAARQAGLRIPHDLSVIGFDDVEYARWCGPPLTTVRQPLTDMGATAAAMVVALAAGDQPAETRVELATTLIVRESTANIG
ncbi:LacI family DNA-binding transcriptional regulator, partial [Rhizocola hellebori]|uniref:LacI family DNA-binding transcriptional regulator n=1 Tax=Rhizocola hellebori TaxID=1392758 RepID=UPI001943A896